MDPRVIIIAAIADNGVIGRDGDLPWHLRSDLKRFQTLTQGGTVVMGRKTHESIVARLGHPLPNRTSVVLSADPSYRAKGCVVENNLEIALDRPRKRGNDVFVIGGESIYRKAFWMADELHLTHVHHSPDGDARFHEDPRERFVLTEQHRFAADSKNDHDYTFAIYHRILPEEGFVYLPNARQPEQWAIMERIQFDRICPFCPNGLRAYHKENVLRMGRYWLVTNNQWPYANTRVHLLIIARQHWQELTHISPKAWTELGELVKDIETKNGILGGGLGLRFGEPRLNGGTVCHLHWQILTARTTNPADPDYCKVRLNFS